jgi:hypothetical protein
MFDQILSALHQHANAIVAPQEPSVIVEPHFFIMLLPSETFCMLSAFIILAII